MLIRLAIANLATIKSLTLDCGPGFTVLTGETGAGKSILIDALRFVLGGKASTDQVRSGSPHTLVEAVFDIGGEPEVVELLAELDIPSQGELILRRALQESGRSRALANDCTITQAKLEELGNYLVNIHGQHDNQMLLNPASHVRFLDAFANLESLRQDVAESHSRYARLLQERNALNEKARAQDEERRHLLASVEELQKAQLKTGEEAALREEHTLLTHAEQLSQLSGKALSLLYEGDTPVMSSLGEVAQLLGQAANIDGKLTPHLEGLKPIRYQLEDLYQALRSYTGGLEEDANRLEAVNTRLAEIEKLNRKHGGTEESAILALEQAQTELNAMERSGETLAALEQEVSEVAEQLHGLSRELSEKRLAAGKALDGKVVAQLMELGMTKAAFETRIEPLKSPAGKTPYFTANGVDKVEFLLNTNPGQSLRPLTRIASGGELSRTMLALKTILAKADPTMTLIFDEVDAGISGAIAEIVGRKLKGLGDSHQVLCITHLPQIAALGASHVQVSKHTDKEETYTRVARLTREEKVQEVARLLSGLDISDHSLASAEEMVNRGHQTAP